MLYELGDVVVEYGELFGELGFEEVG